MAKNAKLTTAELKALQPALVRGALQGLATKAAMDAAKAPDNADLQMAARNAQVVVNQMLRHL